MCFLTFSFLMSGIAFAAPASTQVTAEGLLKKAIRVMQVENEEATYIMKLVGKAGDTATRKMNVFFKKTSEDAAKLLIRFSEPTDIRGTGFLTVIEEKKDGDQWLYLPAIKKSRRLKGGNRDESFLGSDFSMGDLSVDRNDGLKYVLSPKSVPCDGGECYELTGTLGPDASGDRTYSKKVILLRKDSGMQVKTDFYNKLGQLEKVMRVSKSHREGSRWVIDTIEMKNVLTGHATIIEFEKRKNNVVEDHVFTVSNLERG